MKSIVFLFLVCFATHFMGAQTQSEKDSIARMINSVVEKQIIGWNDGSIESFMEGYLKSDSLRFASGGDITYGWENMRGRYKNKYSSKDRMGQLTFSDITVDVLSLDAALVFGKWRLIRTADQPWGLFTLIFKNKNGAWRIVHDHTSSGH